MKLNLFFSFFVLAFNARGDSSASVGQSVTLSVSAGGTSPFTYQWFKNGSEIFGATESTLGFSPVTLSASGKYLVRVSNSAGSSDSLPVVLSIVAPRKMDIVPITKLFLMSPAGLTSADKLSVTVGTTLIFLGQAFDGDGDMSEHWMEIQNPDGVWSWGSEGKPAWLVGEPWEGGLVGNALYSLKEAVFVFTTPGVWHVRTTAIDTPSEASQQWIVSNVCEVTVVAAPAPTPPTQTPVPQPAPPLPAPPIPDPTQTIPIAPDITEISKLFGPTAAPGTIKRTTNLEPVHHSSPDLFERVRTWELGAVGGDTSDNWSALTNVVGIDNTTYFDTAGAADVTQGTPGNVGLFASQSMATYSGVIAISPQREYSACGEYPNSVIGGYIPLKQLVKGAIGQATCLARSSCLVTNEAWHGNVQGLLFPVNLPTSRAGSDWPLPVIRVTDFSMPFGSSGLALTSQNELLIAVGISPTTGKGKIAFLAVEGKYLPSHTMKRMSQPNEGSWSDIKLLGVQDLPFVPNDVSASSNGSWSGPSQTVGSVDDPASTPENPKPSILRGLDLGDIDLSKPWIRSGMLIDDENNPEVNLQWGQVLASKGYAVVSSKEAGQTVVFDLSPYFEYIRQSYLAASQDDYLAICDAEDKGEFPATFEERPEITPKLVATFHTPNVSKVLATQRVDRWTLDNNHAWVFTEDGFGYTLDCSSLWARFSWQPSGPLALSGPTFIAKNITDAFFGFFSDEKASVLMPPGKGADGLANVLIVISRAEQAAIYLSAYGNDLKEFRRITDVSMNDPIAGCVCPRTNQLIVASFLDKKLFQFVIGATQNNQHVSYSFDNNGLDYFLAGSLDLPVFPVKLSNANIN